MILNVTLFTGECDLKVMTGLTEFTPKDKYINSKGKQKECQMDHI